MKELYKGTFNNSGEIIELYRYASSNNAYAVLVRALAKKLGVTSYAARQTFRESKLDTKIERVK